ncbi:hypothetical protein RHS01_04752 [Rhizoctonia solani]|uniref:Uncharacterized protein n=1 Tax=Rhizoctonia solani TaxID=456999 RepID=A0A8H7M5V3_9AGAM|nr:hypothetical protein RHS01_04752 [Rhizoctonia solani]
MDQHLDIWDLILHHLSALGHGRKSTFTPLLTDWEWNAIAQTTRSLNAQTIGTGELQTGAINWSRYENYAAHVHTITVKIDGAYRNWVFLLPIKRLAATRRCEQTTADGRTHHYFPPLLPNLVSLTFEYLIDMRKVLEHQPLALISTRDLLDPTMSLVSFKGFSASPYMMEALALLPNLSEIALYHMPGHQPIPLAHEYVPRLPVQPSVRFPALIHLQILACHNRVEEIHRILTHFPIECLQSLSLEFSQAHGIPSDKFMDPLYALIGNQGHCLRALSLIYDAEKWDYISPTWDVESVAWPLLSKLCISETLLGVDVVEQSTRPRLVDMRGLAELALAFPRLKTLHLTLDVDDISTFGRLPVSDERPPCLPLDLDLGYSPLVGDIAEDVARQLLLIWPGLRSLRTYWKEHRPVGVHAIYLTKWREVIRHCGPSVVDGHNTDKCHDGHEEQAYWRAI